MKELGQHQAVHEWYPKGLGRLDHTLVKELRDLSVTIPLTCHCLKGPFQRNPSVVKSINPTPPSTELGFPASVHLSLSDPRTLLEIYLPPCWALEHFQTLSTLVMVPLMSLLSPYCTQIVVQGNQMVATAAEHMAPPSWEVGLQAPINYIRPEQLATVRP